jgi:hypothetical protein
MDYLEGDELVIGGVGGGDEEERCISAVDDFGVYSEGQSEEGTTEDGT